MTLRAVGKIEQDQERRIVLREHDIASIDPVAPHYIADSVRSALRHGYHVVLEGILHADRYGTVRPPPGLRARSAIAVLSF